MNLLRRMKNKYQLAIQKLNRLIINSSFVTEKELDEIIINYFKSLTFENKKILIEAINFKKNIFLWFQNYWNILKTTMKKENKNVY